MRHGNQTSLKLDILVYISTVHLYLKLVRNENQNRVQKMDWLHVIYLSDDGSDLTEIHTYKPWFFPSSTCNNTAVHGRLIVVDWQLSI